MITKETPSDAKDGHAPMRARLRFKLPANLLLLPALVATFVAGAFVSPVFLNPSNIVDNIAGSSAPLALLSLGLTLILLTDNFDLSLQSTVGFAPMLAGLLMVPSEFGGVGANLNPFLGFVIALVLGAGIGAFNAMLIVKVGLNGFMVTLSMLIVVSGLTLGFSNGRTVSPLPDSFTYLGNTHWLGVPVSVWLVGAISLVIGGFLRYHRIGRSIYAIGGNLEAARASGISVDRIRVGVFVVGGALAALGGIVISGITSAVTANQGNNMIFSAFAAVVIGGVSLQGGKGTVLGVLSGVLLLGAITNVLTLAQVSSFWIDAIYGVVILLALLVGRIGGKGHV
ncbi:ABC transporter permease [Phycicoccus sp. Soil802]|uniref:ABC transporter permease n=1 Tax=Phycicoccus sp. Soil802 TaxID=1736414 RepID=UPI0019111017|nr:ABC transporter permease [Phycicoccus sp. Soil802]